MSSAGRTTWSQLGAGVDQYGDGKIKSVTVASASKGGQRAWIFWRRDLGQA